MPCRMFRGSNEKKKGQGYGCRCAHRHVLVHSWRASLVVFLFPYAFYLLVIKWLLIILKTFAVFKGKNMPKLKFGIYKIVKEKKAF